jgi:glycosyltransferase involved in cell wall biosynthesis
MNRLHHLKQTLIANICNNPGIDHNEFIVLDYNSTDGTELWVKSECQEFISSGVLKYYRSLLPKDFDRSHSRNIALRLAEGDVICNLDADNFTGEDFTHYIEKQFSSSRDIFLCGGPDRDTKGRICAQRTDWLKIKGFDETFVGYGYEDTDVINRLSQTGLTPENIPARYLAAIRHEHQQRLTNHSAIRELQSVFLSYQSENRSVILYLMKSGELIHGTLKDDEAAASRFPGNCTKPKIVRPMYTVLEQTNWERRNWVPFSLKEKNKEAWVLDPDENSFESTINILPGKFFRILDPVMLENAMFFYFEVANSVKMNENKWKADRVNSEGFGRTVVYKNFDYSTPITLT